MTKRVLDFVGASMGIVLLSPLLAAISVALLVFLGRPVLFRQVRPGLHGHPFTLYKFRTMQMAESPDTPQGDAERLTKFGRWLRNTSLDELPELWNVVRGDMSMVGPRPLLTEYLPLYTAAQARRHEVRPGITGWAQVQGRNLLPWEEKFENDVWYVDNLSIWLDVRILGMTFGRVLEREGVNQQGEATVERFRGSVRESGRVQ
ncbi:sugar transferase [Gemmatimonadota bacterium]